ncbi:MAG: fructosamine kinase family protein [Bacteroidota bacterium]
MNKELKAHIEYQLCVKIEQVQSISGGDISQAYRLETESERFFCKVHSGFQALAMFSAEKAGLEAIALTNTIATPRVLLCDSLEKGAFLVMEYVEPKRPTSKEMELLGHQLAAMHQSKAPDSYGWDSDNYIGSLPQYNKRYKSWTDFYVRERLLPQLKLAHDNEGLSAKEIPSGERLSKVCSSLFPETRPSILHGDLWGGNYLIAANGHPYLIDPATYNGHYEVDLAMTRLFGGFSSSFYDAHSEHFDPVPMQRERTDIYQLYYLLVHLNLFGRSYYGSVSSILNRYF